jgi:metal-sulfur cluster biosynthetic enzyme
MENANPTIIAATDLPTRKPTALKEDDDNPLGILASVLPTEVVHDPFDATALSVSSDSDFSDTAEPIDEQEIYDLIATISDPEHPLSLGSLAVVNLPDIHIEPLNTGSASRLERVKVLLTPTINHCSLATVIGLGVRVRLEQALPPRYRMDVQIKAGTHASAEEVNKQLADKERVAAALENRQLWGVLRKMMETCV